MDKEEVLETLEKTQCFNGDFAVCPVCGKTMVHGFTGAHIKWLCMFGCGAVVLERLRKGPHYRLITNHNTA